jgi:VCBS repeat-containing protein
VSHAEDGEVLLGTSVLSHRSIDSYAAEIVGWQHSLTGDADLLIYGCDLAASESGLQLLEDLNTLTGADIAASDDDTGHALYAGDWDLEYSLGHIESSVAFSTELQQQWVSKLAVITVDTTADIIDGGDGLTSLREAILQVNAGSGGDTIQLGAGTYTLSVGSSGDDAGNEGDLDILQSVTITGAGPQSTIIDGNSFDRVFHIQNNSTVVTMSGITIQNGIASSNAAGIYVDNSSTLNLSNAVLRDNDGTTGSGGAIHVHGTLNLTDVLLTGNTAGEGAGIYFHGAVGGTLTNVTISGNTATNEGGGIWTENAVTIVNSTIAFNTSAAGGGVFDKNGGDITITNTILHNPSSQNSNATLVSGGYNIDSDGSAGLAATGDQTGTDPLLGSLAYNGGATQTHALLAGSSAVNAGTDAAAPATDQRGFSRDAAVDIGAYEAATVAFGATQEFLVNETTTGSQVTGRSANAASRSVAAAPDGSYVVVWSSDQATGSDTDGAAVLVRRFNPDGSPVTGEIHVNRNTVGNQQHASVAMDATGRFVIVWADVQTAGDGGTIYMRRFHADGTAIDATDVRVNSTTTGEQTQPAVAVNDVGDIVVSWQDDNGDEGIRAKRFNMISAVTAGAIATADIEVTATADAINSSVDINNNGDFIVVWQDSDGTYWRTFDSGGFATQAATEFASTSVLVSHTMPDVALFDNGTFVTAVRNTDLIGLIQKVEVVLRDASGTQLGSEVTIADGYTPSLTKLSSGNVILAYDVVDADEVNTAVLSTAGNTLAIIATHAIDQTTSGSQVQASVAALSDDNFVVVWSGNGDQVGQADSVGVFARQLGTALDIQINDDTYTTAQDTVLNVPAAGVLSNDTQGPAATTGNTLGHTAGADNNGDAIWNNSTVTSGFDWDFSGGGVTYTTTPTTSLGNVTAAWVFDGTGGGTADAYATLAGDPTDDPASFEILFNPSDAVGQELIFETGGNGQGTALSLNDSVLELLVKKGSSTALATYDLAAEIAADEFIHVMAVIDNASAVPDVYLYVNGTLVDSVLDVAGLSFWANNGDSGLGAVNGDTATTNISNFQGEIAAFGLYESALPANEVQTNYEAVAAAGSSTLSVQSVDTTGTTGSVVLNSDGSFTYTPQAGFSGTDTFSYTATNGGNTAAATVTITVAAPGDTIVVDTTTDNNDSGIIDGNSTHTIAWLGANKGADGLVSLREAIIAANNTVGTDTIHFGIAGAGPHVISVASALPFITDTVILNGTSQTGYADRPLIVLDGNDASQDGLVLTDSADGSTIQGLAIRDFQFNAIHIQADSDGHFIRSNWLGALDPVTGEFLSDEENGNSGINIEGSHVTVGGTSIAHQNLISGNLFSGIQIDGSSASDNMIIGNLIGTNLATTSVVANTFEGIRLLNGTHDNAIGGTTAGTGNVISGNTLGGIGIYNDSWNNKIVGNYIGTDESQTASLGSAGYGIMLFDTAFGNTIGEVTANAGNVITNSGTHGIGLATSGTQNAIRGNAIYNNGSLGIDISVDGVTTNDADDSDTGTNNLQNFPLLTTVGTHGTDLIISGTITSTPSTTFNIDFYSSATADASGYGEAERYLGSVQVTTDASGNATIARLFTSANVAAGEFVTATATDTAGNTSEFAASVAASAVAPLLDQFNAVSYAGNDGTQNFDTSWQELAESDGTATGLVQVVSSDSTNALQIGGNTVNLGGVGARREADLTAATTATLTFDYRRVLLGATGGTVNVEVSSDGGTNWTVLQTYTLNATDAGFTTGLFDISAFATHNTMIRFVGAGTAESYFYVDNVQINHDGTGNSSPVAASGNYTINEGQSLTVDGSASTDPNSDTLSFAWDLDNDGNFGEAGEPITASAVVTWATLQSFGINDNGSYTIGLQVSDGKGGTDSTTTTLTVSNVAPTMTSATNVSIAENTTTVQTVTATDPVDTLTYGITGGTDQSRFTINAVTGALSFIAAPDFESPADADTNNTYLVQVTAADGDGGTASHLMTVTVTDANDNAPVISAGQTFSISESAANGTAVGTVAATDADTGTTFSNWTITGGNTDGIFAINTSTGQITVANDTNLDFETTNSYTLSLTVSDGTNTSANQTVTINVTDANEAPTASLATTFTITEGSALNLDASASTDPDGDLLTYNWDLDNDGLFDDATTAAPSISWAALQALGIGDDGSHTIRVRVSDAGSLQAVASSTLTVTNVAPTASADSGAGFRTNEDTSFRTASVLTNDSDINSADTLGVLSLNTAGTRGLVTSNGDGTFTYNPNGQFESLGTGQQATDTFSYTITDGDGGTSTATVTILINGINDQPVVRSQLILLTDTDAQIHSAPGVLAGAADAEGQPLTAVLLTLPTQGTVTLNLDGSWTYQPNADFSGTDFFTFAASDGSAQSAVGRVAFASAIVAPPPASPPAATSTASESTESTDDSDTTTEDAADSSATTTTGDLTQPEIVSHAETQEQTDTEDSDGFAAFNLLTQGNSADAVSWNSTQTQVSVILTDRVSSSDLRQSRDVDYRTSGVRGSTLDQELSAVQRHLNALSYQFVEHSPLWEQLDSFEEDVARDLNFDKAVVGSVGVVSTGFAVGSLIWAARGGILLSGLLAQLPTWTMFDPLLVIDGVTEDEDEGDSIRDIVDQQDATDQSDTDPSDGTRINKETEA